MKRILAQPTVFFIAVLGINLALVLLYVSLSREFMLERPLWVQRLLFAVVLVGTVSTALALTFLNAKTAFFLSDSLATVIKGVALTMLALIVLVMFVIVMLDFLAPDSVERR